MTEAWFLHDEKAIRQASSNPRGKRALYLPRTNDVEQVADPKDALFQALLEATEASGRRLVNKKRELSRMRLRVAELIDDFSPLLGLSAFNRFLADLEHALSEITPLG